MMLVEWKVEGFIIVNVSEDGKTATVNPENFKFTHEEAVESLKPDNGDVIL